jgi:hypothetical protein
MLLYDRQYIDACRLCPAEGLNLKPANLELAYAHSHYTPCSPVFIEHINPDLLT